MVNTKYDSTPYLIIKLQTLKGETKLKFCQSISNYYDEMKYYRQNGTFQFLEDPFIWNAPGVCKNYHEVLLLMNFLQIKSQVKNMNLNYYDLYYIVIKNTNEK